MRMVGHIAGMGDIRNVYRFVACESEGEKVVL
jgi:hypothetical protein